MKPKNSFSRRDFLARLAALGATCTVSDTTPLLAQPRTAGRSKILGFTKPFQTLSFEDTADVVAQVGWEGIECPVRQKGQVLPERVEDDLPKLVQALKKRNLELVIMATDIHNVTDPLTEKVLRAASKLGIKLYRLAHLSYKTDRSLPEQLNNIRAELRDLRALNQELGLCATYENHSGRDSVGAPVWDLYELLKDFDPQYYGVCFDIGHATLEGGYAWPLHFRLLRSILRVVYVKDFAWKQVAHDWKAEWCPLGEGMVNQGFFQMLKQSAFAGPIVQHHEYPVGVGADMVKAMQKDLHTLKAWLANA